MNNINNPDAWIQTYTGKAVWPLSIKPEDILIEDIAHALSLICRFTGHTREFYSVAQHSVEVSNIVTKEYKLEALLHDGSEAYINDIARPIKNHPDFSFYKEIEKNIQNAIIERFGISKEMHKSVKYADLVLLRTEQRDLLNPSELEWDLGVNIQPLDKKIIPLSPPDSEKLFLKKFEEYGGRIHV